MQVRARPFRFARKIKHGCRYVRIGGVCRLVWPTWYQMETGCQMGLRRRPCEAYNVFLAADTSGRGAPIEGSKYKMETGCQVVKAERAKTRTAQHQRATVLHPWCNQSWPSKGRLRNQLKILKIRTKYGVLNTWRFRGRLWFLIYNNIAHPQ